MKLGIDSGLSLDVPFLGTEDSERLGTFLEQSIEERSAQRLRDWCAYKPIDEMTEEELARCATWCNTRTAEQAREWGGAGEYFGWITICPTVKARVQPGPAPSWAKTMDERRAEAGERYPWMSEELVARLGEAQARIEAVNRTGKTSYVGKDVCRRAQVDLFDIECSNEQVRRWIWLEDVYEEAQAALRVFLAHPMPPAGAARTAWFDYLTRWLSIAHAATGVNPRFLWAEALVGRQRVGDRMLDMKVYGPPRVQELAARWYEDAKAAGHDLFIPPLPAFRYTPEQYATYGSRDPDGTICVSWDKGGGTDCTLLIICEPKPAWRCEASLAPTNVFRAALASDRAGLWAYNRLVPSSQTRVALRKVVVPAAQELEAYVRAWAQDIVDLPFARLLTQHAWTLYYRYLDTNVRRLSEETGRSYREIIGMSAADLENLHKQLVEVRADRMVDLWKESVKGAAGIIGGIYATVFGVVLELLGALLDVLPLASGCPWMPWSFLIRSPAAVECNVDPTLPGGMERAVDAVVEMGSRAGFQFIDFFDENPGGQMPLVPPGDDFVEDTGIPWGKIAIGAGVALAGVVIWKKVLAR